jgi:hypothetical protein
MFPLAVMIAGLALAGCAGTSPAPGSSASPSSADSPPEWVQREAMWQSLAAGDAQPRSAQWLLTDPDRASHLNGRETSYLRSLHSMGDVYVVVLQGHFRPQEDQGASASSLYLVLGTHHSYLAHGSASASIDLAGLGRVHTYIPQLPVQAGVWGHTMAEGGPFPGGPSIVADANVAVWKGDDVAATGKPLMEVHSDANGFFVLDLAPGVYTLKLADPDHGYPAPDTVTVEAGKPVAAGVYGVMR